MTFGVYDDGQGFLMPSGNDVAPAAAPRAILQRGRFIGLDLDCGRWKRNARNLSCA